MNQVPTIEIIATGSELLSGRHLNTNAAHLSRVLSAQGYQIFRHQTLGDDREILMEAVRKGFVEADIIITTGGLGPTLDDLTREVLSDATGISLEHSEELAEQIRERFRTLDKAMPEINLVQAKVPVSGGWFPNPNGTAPGLWFDLGKKTALALPGPPRELNPMLEQDVLPLLASRYKITRKQISRSLSIVAFGESNVEELSRPIIESFPAITYSILARPGLVEVTLSRWVEQDISSDPTLDEVFQKIHAALGPVVFTTEKKSLEEVVGELLRSQGLRVVTAESCTGGLIAESLTRISGSSDYFLGAFVTYSNEMKISILGIPPERIEKQGAVSPEVAAAMAEGALERSGADYAIAVTGIAGPTGGTKDKPVGLVYIAVANRQTTRVRKHRFFGDRDAIRERAQVTALGLLRSCLLNLDEENRSGATI